MNFKSKFFYGTYQKQLNEDNQDGEALSLETKIGYGAGHVFNDMVTVLLMGYRLVFLKYVIHMADVDSGLIIFSGQIINGLSTALIGLVIDLNKNCYLYNHYGKRKLWHLIGTICVVISFPFLCLTPIGLGISNYAFRSCKDNEIMISNSNFSTECIPDEKLHHITLYYTLFNVLQNFGWAIVQSSHLSLIPYLTTCDKNQLTLNSIRNTATTASFLFVYSIACYFFDTGEKVGEQADKELKAAFQNMVYIIVAFGLLCSYLFHHLVKEKDISSHSTPDKQNLTKKSSLIRLQKLSEAFENDLPNPSSKQPDTVHKMKILQWFLEPQFYLIALHFTATRLFFQTSKLYIPFFVNQTLKLPNEYMATVPLVMYSSGLLVSGATKCLCDMIGLKQCLGAFSIFGLGGCLWILFGCNNQAYYEYEVFGIGITIGGAGSALLILSTTMIGACIGLNKGKIQRV